MPVVAFASPTNQHVALLLRNAAKRMEDARRHAERTVQYAMATSPSAAEIIPDLMPGECEPYAMSVCADALDDEQ